MNIGIIGAGWIAEKMAITLQGLAKDPATSDIKAYAISSRSQEKAQEFADKWGFEKAYGSYEELVKDPNVDLVYVATPHSHHYAHTKMALEQGKACLVEKAFTANAREAKELLDIAHEKKIFIAEAIWTRYQPIREMILDVIKSGRIGEPRLVYASLGYQMETKERILRPDLCGGALLDLGVYSINFVRMFVGGDWKEIKSQCVKSSTGMDMHDSISVIYNNGIMANMQASTLCINDKHGIISCSQGYIEVDNINNPQRAQVFNADGQCIEDIHCPKQITGYEYQVIACRDAMKQGLLVTPYMSHEETLEIMQIMDGLRKEWGVVYPMD